MGRRLSPSWRWRVWNTTYCSRQGKLRVHLSSVHCFQSGARALGGPRAGMSTITGLGRAPKKERRLFVFDVQMVLPWLISAAWEKTVIYLREDDFGWYSVWFSWAFILKLWFEACLRNWKQLGLNLWAALLWAILNLSRPPRRLHL